MTVTEVARASRSASKECEPFGMEVVPMLINHTLNSSKFNSGKSPGFLQPNRSNPEFGEGGFAFDVNVRRLGFITGIKEKAIWPDDGDRGHGRLLFLAGLGFFAGF